MPPKAWPSAALDVCQLTQPVVPVSKAGARLDLPARLSPMAEFIASLKI